MADNTPLRVAVVYALPARQELVSLSLPEGARVSDALQASGLLAKYPDIDLAQNKLGIYGKLVKPDAALRDRDRVEIYRPLIADPKVVRQQRAASGKAMKKGAGGGEADAPPAGKAAAASAADPESLS